MSYVQFMAATELYGDWDVEATLSLIISQTLHLALTQSMLCSSVFYFYRYRRYSDHSYHCARIE